MLPRRNTRIHLQGLFALQDVAGTVNNRVPLCHSQVIALQLLHESSLLSPCSLDLLATSRSADGMISMPVNRDGRICAADCFVEIARNSAVRVLGSSPGSSAVPCMVSVISDACKPVAMPSRLKVQQDGAVLTCFTAATHTVCQQ